MQLSKPLAFRASENPPAGQIDWLWSPYLAFGTVALLDGDPGVGKSFLALDLAARVSAGLPMPDGQKPWYQPCQVVVVSAEDSIEDTLIPRFRAAGGVPERLSFFGGLSRRGVVERPASFPYDFDELIQSMSSIAPVGMVILDPMMALFPRSISATNDQVIRQALLPFVWLAAKFRCCILLVRHLIKLLTGRSIYRGSGSIGIAGVARTGLLVGIHPDDPQRRVLSMTQSNLGPLGPSQSFHLGQRPGGFGLVWDGPTNLTADELCRLEVLDGTPLGAARQWLQNLLASGPVPATRVESEARAAGLCFKTLRSAKKLLGAESHRVKRDGRTGWEWSLPATPFLSDDPVPELEPLPGDPGSAPQSGSTPGTGM